MAPHILTIPEDAGPHGSHFRENKAAGDSVSIF